MNHLTKLFQIGTAALLFAVTSPHAAVAVAPQSGQIDVDCEIDGSVGFGPDGFCFTGTITCEGDIEGTFNIDTCGDE